MNESLIGILEYFSKHFFDWLFIYYRLEKLVPIIKPTTFKFITYCIRIIILIYFIFIVLIINLYIITCSIVCF